MKNSETCHFWAGHFASIEELTALIEETYADDEETPISPFAAAQDESFYDHDFLEFGFSDSAQTIQELVEGYSYSEEWLEEFENKIRTLGLSDVNAFVFITADEIQSPKSMEVSESSYLRYLGTISFPI
ncbi:MAG: immunity 22 family protein [Pirellulales bacterium]